MTNPNTKPLFQLGRIVATPGLLAAMEKTGETPLPFLTRHNTGEWGECCVHDKRCNERALKDGSRIFSVYRLNDGTDFYIVTEAVGDDGKRASTAILLPSEY